MPFCHLVLPCYTFCGKQNCNFSLCQYGWALMRRQPNIPDRCDPSTFDWIRDRYAPSRGMAAFLSKQMSLGSACDMKQDTVLQRVSLLTSVSQFSACTAGHQRWVWDCVFSVDAAYLVTASSDCSARLWDLSSGDAIRMYSGHHKAAVCCALNDSAFEGRDGD